MVVVVALLGIATLVLVVTWGLRVLNDIDDLENLSSRLVGKPTDLGEAWNLEVPDSPQPSTGAAHSPVRLITAMPASRPASRAS